MREVIITYKDGRKDNVAPDIDSVIAFEDKFDQPADQIGARTKWLLWTMHYILKRDNRVILEFDEWLKSVAETELGDDIDTNPTQPQA